MKNRAGFPLPGQIPGIPMPKIYVDEKAGWEYKVMVRNLTKETAPTEVELNDLGKDEWELAGVFSDLPFVYFYFKRLKK